MKIGDLKAGVRAMIRVSGKLTKVLVGNKHPRGGWNVTLEDGEVRRVSFEDFVAVYGSRPTSAKKEISVSVVEDAAVEKVVAAVQPSLEKRPSLAALVGEAKVKEADKFSDRGVRGCHIVVEALAGTGKTFTLVEGVRRIYGQATRGVIGSQQQEAIWRAMASGEKPETACFVAFNKSIADELQRRVEGTNCQAMTLHSLGLQACKRVYNLRHDSIKSYKTDLLIESVKGCDVRELKKKEGTLVAALRGLTNLCKLTLCDPTEENLKSLAKRFEIGIGENEEEVLELVPQLVKLSRENHKIIDFADMIWLPVVNNLPVEKFDLLLVDEAQDMNACQQALAQRAGRRLILCGDPRQAIYGFAGADTESMPRMTAILEGTENGCQTYPLTVTRRCGKKIVELAQTEVPEFEAYEKNPEGHITHDVEQSDAWKMMEDGEMVLCRVNAPLVSLVFKLIKMKKKANIQGRNIGEALWDFIEGLKASSVQDLYLRLDDHYQRELERLRASKWGSEAQEIALSDKVQCVKSLAAEVKSVEQIKTMIESIFDDKSRGGILLSSIHRAKGLEASRVWIIEPNKLPHPMAKSDWQKQQECNLWYVAVTRAIKHLVFVKSTPKKMEDEE